MQTISISESTPSTHVENSNDYRWFCALQDPGKISHKDNDYWAQYHIDLSDLIEDSYQKKASEIELNGSYDIKFDYGTNAHFQIHKNNFKDKRPVIRQLPNKVPNILRADRIGLTEKHDAYENNFIVDIQMFCYSHIFNSFQINTNDPFIRRFTSHSVLLNKKFVAYFTTDYIQYLKEIHDLNEFNFEKLKEILSEDFGKNKGLIPYVNHYVKNLTPKNFTDVITRMFSEEGELYKNLNKLIRMMSLDGFGKYAFYFLCLLFVHENHPKRFEQTETVYRVTEIPNELYEKFKTIHTKENVIINYDFMPTTRVKAKALSVMKYKTMLNKILYEILIEKENSENPFLAFKLYDISQISQYQEEEIIIPPNVVFVVKQFHEEKGKNKYSIIQMELKTNLFHDSHSLIQGEIGNQLGIYRNFNISENDYLKVLSLKAKNWQTENVQLLSNFANLQQLDLSGTNIKDEGLKCFSAQLKSLMNLRYLDLSRDKIGDEGIKAFSEQLSTLQTLQYLNLSGNEIGNEGMIAFSRVIYHLTNLYHLNLCMNFIGDEAMLSFGEQLTHLKNLQKLNLSVNSMGDEGIKAISKQMSSLTNLLSLNLSENKIQDKGIQAFAQQMFHLANLQQLNLAMNEIGDEGMLAFAGQLFQLINLQQLNLSINTFGKEGSQAVVTQMIHLNNLRQLILYEIKMGDDVLKLFSKQLIYLPKLQLLDLCGNQLGDEGIKTFAGQLLHLSNLQLLNLRMNAIGVEGIEALKVQLIQLTNLKELDLRENQIGDENLWFRYPGEITAFCKGEKGINKFFLI